MDNQIPLKKVAPEYALTYGDDCISLCSAYGLVPDVWQANYIRDFFAHAENGKPLASICGLDVPRQNGKNAIFEAIELFCICVLGWNILHTAHEVKTANKAFKRLRAYFEQADRYPELAAMVKQIRRTNGQEAIYLKRTNPDTGYIEDWGSIEFSARTRGAARGFADIQLIAFDEAQELTDEQQEAMMSTLAASSTGTRMLCYMGTPTPPGSPGTVMQRVRRDALSGSLKGALWHSWALDDYKKITTKWEDVLKIAYRCNPALGTRLDEDYTYTEFKSMSPDGFARERCDWWVETAHTSLISESNLQKCATDTPPKADRCVKTFGIKFDPEGMDVSIAVCAKDRENEDSKPHIELIEVKEQSLATIRWIADFIAEREDTCAAVAIDGRSGTGLLINELRAQRRVSMRMIHVCSTREVSDAAQRLEASIGAGALTWYGVPGAQDRLKDSMLGAIKRPIGKYGDWAIGGEDSTPAEAASLALWIQATTKRDPFRKQRIR